MRDEDLTINWNVDFLLATGLLEINVPEVGGLQRDRVLGFVIVDRVGFLTLHDLLVKEDLIWEADLTALPKSRSLVLLQQTMLRACIGCEPPS